MFAMHRTLLYHFIVTCLSVEETVKTRTVIILMLQIGTLRHRRLNEGHVAGKFFKSAILTQEFWLQMYLTALSLLPYV